MVLGARRKENGELSGFALEVPAYSRDDAVTKPLMEIDFNHVTQLLIKAMEAVTVANINIRHVTSE